MVGLGVGVVAKAVVCSGKRHSSRSSKLEMTRTKGLLVLGMHCGGCIGEGRMEGREG
jgi:hypothetical protein